MTLPRLLTRALLAGLLALGLAQYLLYQRATAGIRTFVTQVRPGVLIKYDSYVPFLWGGGRAWNLSFEPAGGIKLGLDVPFGYRLVARELRLHDVEMAVDGLPLSFEVTLLGLTVPVPERPAAAEAERTTLALPRLSELGLPQLEGNARLRVQRTLPASRWDIRLEALAPTLARLDLRAAVAPGPAFLRGDFHDMALTEAVLRFADHGLLARVQEWMAVRARVSAARLQPLLAERLDRLADEQQWKLDASSLAALRGFVRKPEQARVSLAPLHPVLLKNLVLYAPGDRFALLGFSFADRAEFERAAPGEPP